MGNQGAISGPCGSELFPGALTNELSLELREAGQQMQVQPPLWRGGVQRLAYADQPDAGDGEQGQQGAKILNAAAEAVEPVDEHNIDLKLPLEMGVLSFVQNVDKELRNGGKASTCGIHAGI